MPRGSTSRVAVEKSKASSYKAVADNFFDGASVARKFEYWNAAGVLIVHSAIAYADAISIKFAGVKSRGGDHHETVVLLDELVSESDGKKSALSRLHRIIEHKNAVSYSGEVYGRKDIEQLWKLVVRFREWATGILE